MVSKEKRVDTSTNVATASSLGIITVLISSMSSDMWIVNIGASNHMVHSLNLMN